MMNLSGTVLFRLDGSSSPNFSGTTVPWANVPVVLQVCDQEPEGEITAPGLCVLTDSKGSFSFVNVPSGSYRVAECGELYGGEPSPGDFASAKILTASPADPKDSLPGLLGEGGPVASLTPNALSVDVREEDITGLSFVDALEREEPEEASMETEGDRGPSRDDGEGVDKGGIPGDMVLPGPKGATGPKGQPGPVGPQGNSGSTEDIGPQGCAVSNNHAYLCTSSCRCSSRESVKLDRNIVLDNASISHSAGGSKVVLSPGSYLMQYRTTAEPERAPGGRGQVQVNLLVNGKIYSGGTASASAGMNHCAELTGIAVIPTPYRGNATVCLVNASGVPVRFTNTSVAIVKLL